MDPEPTELRRVDEPALTEAHLVEAGRSLCVPVPEYRERADGALELDLGPWGGVWEIPAAFREQAGDLH